MAPLVTVATPGLFVVQRTARPGSSLPFASSATALICAEPFHSSSITSVALKRTAATGTGGTGRTTSTARPYFPSLVARMPTSPTASVDTTPLPVTVAMASFSDVQVTGRSSNSSSADFGCAWSVTCSPTITDGNGGVTRTAATGLGTTGAGVTASLQAAIRARVSTAARETVRAAMLLVI